MVLILTLGPMQVTSAKGFDSAYQVSSCTLALTDSLNPDLNNNVDETAVKTCHGFSACAAHFNCAPLQFSTVLTTTVQVAMRCAISIDSERISTRYPPIPQHPPQS